MDNSTNEQNIFKKSIVGTLTIFFVLIVLIAGAFASNRLVQQGSRVTTKASTPDGEVLSLNNCDYSVGANERYTSIQAAINKAQTDGPAGKTICIRNDKVYEEWIRVTGSGRSDNRFTIKGHPENTSLAVLRRNDGYSDALKVQPIILVKANYVTIENLEIARSPGQGITFTNVPNVAEGLLLKNLKIHDTFMAAFKSDKSRNMMLDGLEIYNNVLRNSPSCLESAVCDRIIRTIPNTIAINDAQQSVIQNTKTYGNYGGAISLLRSKNITIRNNEGYNSIKPNIHFDQSNNILVENNLFYATRNNLGVTLLSHDEAYDGWSNDQGHTVTIRNNIIIGQPIGLNFTRCEDQPKSGDNAGDLGLRIRGGCNLYDTKIYNNTLLHNHQYALNVLDQTNAARNEFYNNIVYVSGTAKIFNGAASDIAIRNNYFSKAIGIASIDNQNKITQNIAQLFSSSQALNKSLLIPGAVNASLFAVNAQYSQYGADASKVGINKGSQPPTPTALPTGIPTITPSVAPTETTDPPTPIPTISGSNLLPNSSFESELGTQNPAYYSDGIATFSHVLSSGRTGSRSLKINASNVPVISLSRWMTQRNTIAAVPLTPYQGRVWADVRSVAEGAQVQLVMSFWNNNNIKLVTVSSTPITQVTSGWQEIMVEGVSPATTAYVKVDMILYGTGNVNFDDISLFQTSP